LTVTGGGINAHANAAINMAVTVGAPQTWTVDGGKTLSIGGDVHTIINNLTISGPGNAVISGSIDGGGALNTMGSAPGSITVTGGTYLYLDGGGKSYSVNVNVANGGLVFSQPNGTASIYYGVIGGGGWIDKWNSGKAVLVGANNYTNWTSIYDGVIQADSGAGLPSASFLNLGGGVLQAVGEVTFTRSLGTSGADKFRWSPWIDGWCEGGGGFAAGDYKMTINIGGSASPQMIAWGAGDGAGIMETLKLGSTTSNNVTEFRNGINLNGAVRTVYVADNPDSPNDIALISGFITDTTGEPWNGGLNKTGPGTLRLTAGNDYGDGRGYNGCTTISDGALQANRGAGLSGWSGLILDGGVLQSDSEVTYSDGFYWGTGETGYCFTWKNGGFAAGGGKMTVNITGGITTLKFGDVDGRAGIMGSMKLSSNSAQYETEIQNAIDLNGGARTIQVDDNPFSAGDFATISSSIGDSVGGGGFTKSGLGLLQLTGAGNTYTGDTTVLDGTLILSKSSGYAIPGNLTITATTGRTFVILEGSNQIAPTATVTFGGGNWPYLSLHGNNQTLAGISDSTGNGVIQNTFDETDVTQTSTLTVNNTTDCSFDGYLRDTRTGTGALALVKNGPSTLTLAGGNISYSGGTSIAQGKLVFKDLTNTVFADRSVANNGVLGLNSVNAEFAFTGPIGGTGAVEMAGGGKVTLGGASGNTYSGGTTVSAGTVVLAKTAGYAIPGDFTIANANTYVVVQNANQFPSTAKITFAGTGDPHFELFGHTVTVAGISGTGGGAIENTEGESGPTNGTLIVNNTDNCSYSGIIRNNAGGSGTLTLVKSGTGTLTLSGYYSSEFTGGLVVNNGTLDFNGASFLPACNYTIAGGTLNTRSLSKSMGTFQITGGTVTGTGSLTSSSPYDVQAGTVDVGLAGSGIALNKTGSGTATLSGTTANSYTGGTTITGGKLILAKSAGVNAIPGNVTINNASGGSSYLILNASSQISTSGVMTFSPSASAYAYFEVYGNAQTLASISDSTGRGVIENSELESGLAANGTLTVNNSADCSFNGYIRNYVSGSSGTLALVKSGSAKLTLSGPNSGGYSGGLTVAGGTLDYSGGVLPGLANGVYCPYVISGGTLNIGGGSQSIGTFQMTGGSIIGGGTLSSTAAYDVQAGTISVNLAGSVGLTKSGTGIVNLTVPSTYAGATTVNDGTLRIGTHNVIPDATSLVLNGGSFNIYGYSETVQGVQLLSGTISSSTGILTSNSAFDVRSGTVSGRLGGSLGLTKSGSGNVTLSGTNTYTGATTVNAGTLTYGANNVLANGSSIVVNGGTLDIGTYVDTVAGVQLLSGSISGSGGTLTSSSAYDLRSGSVSAKLGGTVGLTKSSDFTVVLLSANTYTGATTINAGTLTYGANDAISNSSALVIDGGTLDLNGYSDTFPGVQLLGGGSITGSGSSLTSDSTYNVQSGTVGVNLSGSMGLTKTGSGTVNLTVASAYSGATTVNEGMLRTGASNVMPDASTLIVNGGTFSIFGNSDTMAGVQLLSGSISSSVGVLTSTSTFDVRSGTIGARLGGSVGLTKSGTGAVTMTKTNTYTGATAINAGTLAYGINNALADSSSLAVNGGTLAMAGFSDTVAGVQLLGGGSITGVGSTLTSASNYDVQSGTVGVKLAGGVGLTKSGSGTVVLMGDNSYTGNTLIQDGTLALSGNGQIDVLSTVDNRDALVVVDGTHSLKNIVGGGNTFVGNSAHLTVTSIVQDSLTIGGDYSSVLASASAAAVPEPGTLALLATLSVALATAFLRKKR
jgi:autotransporter-associated beta strand protein